MHLSFAPDSSHRQLFFCLSSVSSKPSLHTALRVASSQGGYYFLHHSPGGYYYRSRFPSHQVSHARDRAATLVGAWGGLDEIQEEEGQTLEMFLWSDGEGALGVEVLPPMPTHHPSCLLTTHYPSCLLTTHNPPPFLPAHYSPPFLPAHYSLLSFTVYSPSLTT